MRIEALITLLFLLYCKIEAGRNNKQSCSDAYECSYNEACKKRKTFCSSFSGTKGCTCVKFNENFGCLDRFGEKKCNWNEQCLTKKSKPCSSRQESSKKCKCMAPPPPPADVGCLDKYGDLKCSWNEECLMGTKSCPTSKRSSKRCSCKYRAPPPPPPPPPPPRDVGCLDRYGDLKCDWDEECLTDRYQTCPYHLQETSRCSCEVGESCKVHILGQPEISIPAGARGFRIESGFICRECDCDKRFGYLRDFCRSCVAKPTLKHILNFK